MNVPSIDLASIDVAPYWQALVDTVPGYVCIVDDQLRFLWVNRLRSGLAPEHVVGKSLGDFITADSFDQAKRCAVKVMETSEPAVFVARSLENSDDVRWSEGHLARVPGETARLILAVKDITDEHRARQELRETLKIMRGMIEAFPGFMLLIEPSGRVVAASNEVAKRLNTPSEDLTGSVIYDHIKKQMSKDVADSRRASAQEVVDSCEPRHYIERRADRVFDNVLYPVFAPDGEVGHIAVVSRDITEKRRAEALLEEQKERRWHADKMAALGTLSAGIAHDFNNLLTPIVVNAKRALRPDLDCDSRTNLIEGISSAANQAAVLVRQILAYSSVNTEPHKTFDLAQVVKETIDFARSTLPTHVRVKAMLPEVPIWMSGDSNRIRQAVVNLYVNARQAMEPDGGDLTIVLETCPRCDDLPVMAEAVAVAGGYAKLTVSDTGCGISPKDLPRVFDPFYSTKSSEQGTGLGLFIVNGVASEHGGVAKVEASTAQGTSVAIWLPTRQPFAAREEDDQERPQVSSKPMTVLLVDDHQDVARALGSLLRDNQHDVYTFTTVAEACAEFERRPKAFDAAIVDYQLGDGNGLELIQRLRKTCPDLSALLLSGFVTKELRSTLAEQRVPLVLKPDVVGDLFTWLSSL